MVMVTAPAPVVIFTSPAASMLVRSLTFSTAFFAVGEHTPALQFMFCVALVEIVTDASQGAAKATRASAHNATRIFMVKPSRRASRIFMVKPSRRAQDNGRGKPHP